MATDGSELIKHSTDADRWIVKERDDGTNCNNWHWSERDLTGWAKVRGRRHTRALLQGHTPPPTAAPNVCLSLSHASATAHLNLCPHLCPLPQPLPQPLQQPPHHTCASSAPHLCFSLSLKERLESLLGKMTLLDDATGKCTITSLESMSGTVTVQVLFSFSSSSSSFCFCFLGTYASRVETIHESM